MRKIRSRSLTNNRNIASLKHRSSTCKPRVLKSATVLTSIYTHRDPLQTASRPSLTASPFAELVGRLLLVRRPTDRPTVTSRLRYILKLFQSPLVHTAQYNEMGERILAHALIYSPLFPPSLLSFCMKAPPGHWLHPLKKGDPRLRPPAKRTFIYVIKPPICQGSLLL